MGMQLQDGSRVCIVGGGPAGCFAALSLLKLAQEHGLSLEVMIFEPHDACMQGPRGCKGCAGILSHSSVQNLRSLGLTLPQDVIQSELHSYVVHVNGNVASIDRPNPNHTIFSVYRGAGPRLHTGTPLSGFDGFLLAQAEARGARVIPARVRRVSWEGRPVVHALGERYGADLLVLATGVNCRSPMDPEFGYAPPETAVMALDEFVRPDGWPDHMVAGFFGGMSGLIFGALVPKGQYLSLALFFRETSPEAVERFRDTTAAGFIRSFPSAPRSLCGCYPRIAVGLAPVYYGDRWVAVGDAATSRLYKDGINSAFMTAGAAMRAVVKAGISVADFERSYAPTLQRLMQDNRYGRLMFQASYRVMQNPLLARVYVDAVRAEAGQPPARRIHSRLLWGMLTGDEAYRTLFWLALRPRSMLRLGRAFARTVSSTRPSRGADESPLTRMQSNG